MSDCIYTADLETSILCAFNFITESTTTSVTFGFPLMTLLLKQADIIDIIRSVILC